MTECEAILHDDGTWFYYICILGSDRLTADDGNGLTETLTKTRESDWWKGTFKAETLTRHTPEREQISGYKLIKGIQPTENRPAELTYEEHDYEHHANLYEPVKKVIPGGPVDIPIKVNVLDGEPFTGTPVAGAKWVPRKVTQLMHHREYFHLLPGHLTGFREEMKATLGRMDGVSCYYQDNRFSVYVEVVCHLPKLSGTKNLRVELVKEGVFPARPANSFAGESLQDAATKWGEEKTRLTEIVKSWIGLQLIPDRD